MKILVEIDLPDIDPNDIYKPNSGWFNESGYIDILKEDIDYMSITDKHGDIEKYRFKYIGQVQEEFRP